MDELQQQNTELDDASQPYVGRWKHLVSTTNWEKGRIILEWKTSLTEAEAPAKDYSDDAWSRRVGRVTGQHVGRLRRVFERFGGSHEQFEGLYWSHFQSALDWDDAEMWLEGAVQNTWSVSAMRHQRWETLGSIPAEEPVDTELDAAGAGDELDDDDYDDDSTDGGGELSDGVPPAVIKPALAEVQSSGDDTPKARQKGGTANSSGSTSTAGASIYSDDPGRDAVSFVRPFANLADLPEDLGEAFENYKLAILRQKSEGWQQISRDEVLGSLDALKELALAPALDDAPF